MTLRRDRIMNTESQLQTAFFNWAAISEYREMFARCLFAIPNEGGSGWNGISRGMKMKREGLKAGTADILLAHPKFYSKNMSTGPARFWFNGLFIEMKRPKCYLNPDQKDFLVEMHCQGYAALCCQGDDVAVNLIVTYMTAPEKIYYHLNAIHPKKKFKHLYWRINSCTTK